MDIASVRPCRWSSTPASGRSGGHQWQAATPDEDWTVRDLVNDLAGEDRCEAMPPLLAGSTIAEVGDRFEGDVLGAEPNAAWAAASAAAGAPPARTAR